MTHPSFQPPSIPVPSEWQWGSTHAHHTEGCFTCSKVLDTSAQFFIIKQGHPSDIIILWTMTVFYRHTPASECWAHTERQALRSPNPVGFSHGPLPFFKVPRSVWCVLEGFTPKVPGGKVCWCLREGSPFIWPSTGQPLHLPILCTMKTCLPLDWLNPHNCALCYSAQDLPSAAESHVSKWPPPEAPNIGSVSRSCEVVQPWEKAFLFLERRISFSTHCWAICEKGGKAKGRKKSLELFRDIGWQL